MNAVTKQDAAALVEQVVIQGDLAKLTPADRVTYYRQVCESAGLNPITQPFAYITLNGKLTLYALRAATDQLRKVHGVSIEIKARETVEDCYVVTAQARLGERTDEAIGAVSIGALKGENRANAMMKAETKAKRRVTLSICGLGMLDENEVETIPSASSTYVDKDTGEIRPKITPSAGVEERLPEPQRRKVQGVVEEMRALCMEEDYAGAAQTFELAGFDADEAVFCWTHFDAPTRSKLKKAAKAPATAA